MNPSILAFITFFGFHDFKKSVVATIETIAEVTSGEDTTTNVTIASGSVSESKAKSGSVR